jgi:nucleoside-diphosphate-sugar epimerase
MAKQRILICGATGFLGRNIAERLASRGDSEIVGTYFRSDPYHHPGIRMVKADLTRKEDVDNVVAGMDMIIQTAAVTTGSKDVLTRPYLHVTDNVIMNARLLQAAFDHRVSRYCFTSCSIVYPPDLNRPAREDDLDYSKIYRSYLAAGWMKIGVEKQCEFYAGLGRTKFTIVRHSNLYGPHDKFDLEHSHMCGATITKVLTNADGVLKVWGDGKEARDLLYIDDFTGLVERVVESPERSPFEVYNVGYGKAYTVREVVAKVIEASGKRVKTEYDTTSPHIPITVTLDISKTRSTFHWEPTTTLDDGIRRTIAWRQQEQSSGR